MPDEDTYQRPSPMEEEHPAGAPRGASGPTPRMDQRVPITRLSGEPEIYAPPPPSGVLGALDRFIERHPSLAPYLMTALIGLVLILASWLLGRM